MKLWSGTLISAIILTAVPLSEWRLPNLPTKQSTVEHLQAKTRELKTTLAGLGEMFPGSLIERFRKCGKPNCHCAKKDSKGHGPTWAVTREVHGRTTYKTIPAEAVEQIRAETTVYKQFQQLNDELIDISAQLGEKKLQQAVAGEGIKKNRARRQSGR